MSSGADFFLKKTLGEDFFESLTKFDLWKPGTKTVLDHEEIKTALQIVPRTVMAMLVKELMPMNIGETKEIELQVAGQALMRVTKHERDVYSGDIEQENKKIVDFKFRSLPGVGLIIMSAFELYSVDELTKPESQKNVDQEIEAKIQKLIDEKLALHDLISKVIDKKLMEKDAIDKLVLMKLTDAMKKPIPAPELPVPLMSSEAPVKKEKKLPLKEFLEKRKSKKSKFSITMAKGETFGCPDCGQNIFDGKVFSGCVCLGDDMGRKVFISKSEDSVKVRFSKGWDAENMEMLLDILRKKNE